MDVTPTSELVKKCVRGSHQAQRILYEKYKNGLFVLCLRYAKDRPEAQDMLQEAFLTIFKDLAQFTGAGSLEGWMRRVTVRAALQFLRKRNPIRFAEQIETVPDTERFFFPDAELNSDAILQMVQKLPEGYRIVFNLHCLEAFSYAEIAAELGIAESSVRSQYARACKQLRRQIHHCLSL